MGVKLGGWEGFTGVRVPEFADFHLADLLGDLLKDGPLDLLLVP